MEPGEWKATGRAALDAPTDADWWWRETTWLKHRHTVAEIHPLLVSIHHARGRSFMTVEHVVAVLDAEDPEALVRKWIGSAPPHERLLGLPDRACVYEEGGEKCDRPVQAVNAKYCAFHAAASRRRSTRRAVRRLRSKQSNPSAAIGNKGVEEDPDPLPGILVFPESLKPPESRMSHVGNELSSAPRALERVRAGSAFEHRGGGAGGEPTR